MHRIRRPSCKTNGMARNENTSCKLKWNVPNP